MAMTNLASILKRRDIILPTKVCLVKAMVFPGVMYGCESWIIKKAEHWRTDAFELWCWRRLLRVPWRPNFWVWVPKEIKLVHPKGNQPWTFIGKSDAEAEAPTCWPPAVKSRLIRKDPDSGKDWGQEEKGATEDEMIGRHQWLNGLEFEQTPRDSEGQGSLACCSPRGCEILDTT